jgi:serine-type D-Ala-D-Ala carboxypeptidase (penicillin-binding protein 5/6)
MARRPQRASRGLATRLLGLALGAAVGVAVAVGTQLPLMGRPATATVVVALPTGASAPPAWPGEGAAALTIPSLGVAVQDSPIVLPIASLTKMMTAYVALRHLPLAGDASGPCVVINQADYDTYLHADASGQSYVKVALGEEICERQLLEGLVVGSANNFALILAELADHSVPAFVAEMNSTARAMGLTHTHYAEPSGYKPGSVSTALEQAELAQRFMAEPVLAQIAAMTSVDLPVAGVVTTYTPFLGTDGVVGVKSGRTDAAGGCVVLAVDFAVGGVARTLYVAVLDQRGGDLLGPAGLAALTLAESAEAGVRPVTLGAGRVAGRVGWGASGTPVVLERAVTVWWWAGGARPTVSVDLGRFTRGVRAGEVVGSLRLRAETSARVALVAARSASPPSLLDRLR